MSLKTEKIWLDGELVRWEDAKVHVLAHALHYGTAYFEGIRCYALGRRPLRGISSCKSICVGLPTPERFWVFRCPTRKSNSSQATLEVIRANKLKECYIRPLAFVGLGELGLYAPNNPVNVCIAVWPWGAYLGDEGSEKRHPRQGVFVHPPPRQRDDDQEQGVGKLHQLRAGQSRSEKSRLRRSDHARCRGLCFGSERREHFYRARPARSKPRR